MGEFLLSAIIVYLYLLAIISYVIFTNRPAKAEIVSGCLLNRGQVRLKFQLDVRCDKIAVTAELATP